jgi:class 3 adenylate cyclase/pimeloyl-ACP methyl ester carboxylesterase
VLAVAGGRPQTRYVESDRGYLGYQVLGSGERDIVFLTGALSNVDVTLEEPSAARFFDRLTSMGRVIRYDMLGSGVSDPTPVRNRYLTIEDQVDDIKSVLDAAGSEQAVVYGDAEGGYFAMMLAAVSPERVRSLIIVNSLARLLRAPDYPIGLPDAAAAALSSQYVAQHGTTGAMLELTAPTVANDSRFRTWWTRYQRLALPLGLVKSTFDWFREVDVRAALPLIRVPTLIVARKDALFHRLAFSEYLVEHINDVEFKIVEGADTVPFQAGDFGPILDHVEEFLTGRKEPGSSDRILATVLFTDIVESTALAASIGDQRWLDLLGEHNRVVRAQLDRFRGKELKMTGDGCIATFDGPARAVACAAAIVEQVASIGLTLRAGIHTGEVVIRDGDLAGLGVHIASRVMSQAGNGGVVVSGTVKDLVVGSGIQFAPCGSVALKGVPGEWPLFQLQSLR